MSALWTLAHAAITDPLGNMRVLTITANDDAPLGNAAPLTAFNFKIGDFGEHNAKTMYYVCPGNPRVPVPFPPNPEIAHVLANYAIFGFKINGDRLPLAAGRSPLENLKVYVNREWWDERGLTDVTGLNFPGGTDRPWIYTGVGEGWLLGLLPPPRATPLRDQLVRLCSSITLRAAVVYVDHMVKLYKNEDRPWYIDPHRTRFDATPNFALGICTVRLWLSLSIGLPDTSHSNGISASTNSTTSLMSMAPHHAKALLDDHRYIPAACLGVVLCG